MFKRTLTALALTATVAQPAAADANDLLKGIVGVIIIKELIEHADTVTVTTHTVAPHTHRHTPERGEVCYTEIDETSHWIVIHQMDCYGARVSTSRHRKY